MKLNNMNMQAVNINNYYVDQSEASNPPVPANRIVFTGCMREPRGNDCNYALAAIHHGPGLISDYGAKPDCEYISLKYG